MPTDLIVMGMKSEVYISAWEMQRLSPMEVEPGWNQWSWLRLRSLEKEVQSYKADNERMMKAQEELLQILNMLQRQVNKGSGTKQATNARQVVASKSHDRRDDHGESR